MICEYGAECARDRGGVGVRIGEAIVLGVMPRARRVSLWIARRADGWRIDDACAAACLWRGRREGRFNEQTRLPFARMRSGLRLCARAAPHLAGRLRPGDAVAVRLVFQAGPGCVRCELMGWERVQKRCSADPGGGEDRGQNRI